MEKVLLAAYRRGVEDAIGRHRKDMMMSSEKAAVIAAAMLRLTTIDASDADSLTDLVVPLSRHVKAFNSARDGYFSTQEISELSDAALSREIAEQKLEASER